MFTAQGPSVFHAIEMAVVYFAQVRLVTIIIAKCHTPLKECTVTTNSQRQVHLSLMGSSGHWQVPLIQVAPLL